MSVFHCVQALRGENGLRLYYWKIEVEIVTGTLPVAPSCYGEVEASDITPQESWQPCCGPGGLRLWRCKGRGPHE